MVSEKNIFYSLSHYKSMETLDRRGGASLVPMGMVSRIYVGDYWTLLHTKYISCEPHGFREDFLMFPHYMSMETPDPCGRTSSDPKV